MLNTLAAVAADCNRNAYDAMKIARGAIKTALIHSLRLNNNRITLKNFYIPWKDGEYYYLREIELFEAENKCDIKFTFDLFSCFLNEIGENATLMEILDHIVEKMNDEEKS